MGTAALLVRQFGAVIVYTITEVFFFVAFAVRSQGTKLNTARKLLLHQALFSKGNLESLQSLQFTSTISFYIKKLCQNTKTIQ